MNSTEASVGQAREDGGRVCVIVHGWPQLTMTFVAQELVGLEECGIPLTIATFGEPDAIRHPIHDQLCARVHRLPSLASAAPRFFRAWRKVRRNDGYPRAFALFRSARRSGKWKREWRAFVRATILSAELEPDVRAIYVHFIGAPATLARYVSIISGLPLAASAHARDIWTGRAEDLRAKLADMDWCTTCTRVGADYLRTLVDDPGKIHLIYHGLMFDRLPSDKPVRADSSGTADSPVKLLSVGRTVEKKGFDILLQAFAALPRDLHWTWTHVGGGILSDKLRSQAEELGLSGKIDWRGAQDQKTVMDLYRQSDLFVLPSREAGDGDKDGLPNVLMEAQSQALACLSTDFSEIPELIEDGVTGVLVPTEDVGALAHALERLIRSPAERRRLGDAGYERVRKHFDGTAGFEEIAGLLRGSMSRARVADRASR